MEEESKVPTPRELLKEKADLLGVEYKPNITDAKLQELVNKALGPAIKDVNKTEAEIVSNATYNRRIEMTQPRRVIISCMDPQMKNADTTPPLSISNSIVTLPKMVIPLNVEWTIPQAYYNFLKEQKCSIAVKGKDIKGRAITTNKEVNKYTIQDLPLLTAEEIQSLKQAQIMREGL